jgi:hypothetical protein
VRKALLFSLMMLVPAVASAATPPEGVALKVRRGFYTDVDVGTFFTLLGADGYSNAQTYLQLGAGYDVLENVSVSANFGIGASAANCFATRNASSNVCQVELGSKKQEVSDNFTVTFLNVTGAYLHKLAERLYVSPKVTLGYTLLGPAPTYSNGTEVTSGINAGLGVGVEYATSMDHFSVGADAMVRYIVGPNIVSVAIYPRIKYTF